MSIFVWIYCLQVPASKNTVEGILLLYIFIYIHMEMLALKGYILNCWD